MAEQTNENENRIISLDGGSYLGYDDLKDIAEGKVEEFLSNINNNFSKIGNAIRISNQAPTDNDNCPNGTIWIVFETNQNKKE